MEEKTLEAREALRELGDGVHRDPAGDGWVLLRYADVNAALRDHVRFSNTGLFPEPAIPPREVTRNLLFSDPPVHTQLRRLVSRTFSPRATAELKPHIEGVTAALLASVDGDHMDVVSQLASPLPVTIIADLLAIPDDDRAPFARWSDALAVAFSPVASDDAKAIAAPLVSEFNKYVRDLVVARRKEPADDILSSLLHDEDGGDGLTDREGAEMARMLIAAGNETTTGLIANGLDMLLAHPDQLDRLRRQPELIETAIEEVLRFSPPARMVFRRATQDTPIGSAVVRRGAYVTLDIEAANRDPREFPDPAAFDIARDPNRHLTFGGGIHFCLGAPLARLEAAVALLQLLDRYPELAPGQTEPEPLPFSHATGFSSYPVQLRSARSQAADVTGAGVAQRIGDRR